MSDFNCVCQNNFLVLMSTSVISQSSYFQNSHLFLKTLSLNCQAGNEMNSWEALDGISALPVTSLMILPLKLFLITFINS